MNFKVFILIALIQGIKLQDSESDSDEYYSDEIVSDEDFGYSRIVGGQIIQIESVPYFVSLFYKKRHLCGGSLISANFVLSAAHCMIDNNSSNYKVRSASSRKSRTGRMSDVAEVIPHPQWNSNNLDNDFMLLRLKRPLNFNERQQAIKLADSDKMYYETLHALTSGFGMTEHELQSSEFLRGVVVEISNRDKCKAAYPDFLSDNMFCAGSENKQDSCQGDSGGPIESIEYGTLLGVVSFGMKCADPEFPGVYSKVLTARPWIKSVAGI